MLKDLWSLLVNIVIVSLLVYGVCLGGWYYNVALAYIVLLAIINCVAAFCLLVREVLISIPIKRVDSQWVDTAQLYVVMLIPFFILIGMGNWIVASIFFFGMFWGLVSSCLKRNEYNRRLKENETQEEKVNKQN